MKGWIQIHRKIVNHWLWNNDHFVKWWLYLLIRANHAPAKVLFDGQLIEVNRGQFITSINKLAKELCTTEKRIRNFLELLKKDQMIGKESGTKWTRLTICNYDTYNHNGQSEGEVRDIDGANRGRSEGNKQKEIKIINNENNENNLLFNLPIDKKSALNIPFEDFWNLYDKKVGNKQKLEKKWNSLKDSERATILKYIPEYKQSKPDKIYRKNPETFLNNRGWNDEIIKTPAYEAGVINSNKSSKNECKFNGKTRPSDWPN